MMRSALICHNGDTLSDDGLGRWLNSFSDLTLIIRIDEPRSFVFRRLRREIDRSGILRLLDILAFRIVHHSRHAADVREWTLSTIRQLRDRYPEAGTPTIVRCKSVNEPHVREALEHYQIDFVLARCKQLIGKRTYTIPPQGIFVLHPGICPEYRNSHGCFWAMANGDWERVGTTLLKIDAGVDTGPVFGYFLTHFDPSRESPMLIQHRTLFDNLDSVRSVLESVLQGKRAPIDTTGRTSQVWGQPWYTAWRRFDG